MSPSLVGVCDVYRKTLSNDDIGIVTVLHERMHQMDRFRGDIEV